MHTGLSDTHKKQTETQLGAFVIHEGLLMCVCVCLCRRAGGQGHRDIHATNVTITVCVCVCVCGTMIWANT